MDQRTKLSTTFVCSVHVFQYLTGQIPLHWGTVGKETLQQNYAMSPLFFAGTFYLVYTALAEIVLRHEQKFHFRFAYKQVRWKAKAHAAETFDASHDHIWYKFHKSHLKKQTIFFRRHDNFPNSDGTYLGFTTRRQHGYINSNLMLRWDGDFKI